MGWVRYFEEKIFVQRRVETQNRVAMVTNGQTMNSIATSITFLLNIIILSSLIAQSNQPVTKGSVLVLLWVVAVYLTRPFRQMPWFFTFIFDSWTSLKRVHSFLKIENIDSFQRQKDFIKITSDRTENPAIKVRNLNLKIGNKQILKSIDLEIANGEFVALVGEVGSGKSLLLLSLLGETGANMDDYLISGNDAKAMPLSQLRQHFTYVPQEGFIMSATLRENIAFEYGYSAAHDQSILQSINNAQFAQDLEKIDNGLNTEIGERGVNLSGGQKQRISLARVDFSPATFVLIDDGLSAVDVETEDLLVDSLLKGSWKNKTRILVTHRLTILDQVNRVIFLEEGKIIAQGKFADLLKTNEKFRNFTASVARDTEVKSTAEDNSDVAFDTTIKDPNENDF